MSHIVIALDIGTSSAKALAVMPDGSVMATFQRNYPTTHPQPGFVEQDADAVAESVLDLLKETLDHTGPHRVVGISFSSAMHSLLLADASGRPLTPLVIWADTRSHPQASRLKSSAAGRRLYEATGTPIHPMSPLCKLLWFKENEPALMRRTARVAGIKEYVFYKLLGTWNIDHSIASATGLFDVVNLRWHGEALALAGIAAEQLPAPVPAQTAFTDLLPGQAKRLGLDRKIPLIIGASDGCLANLGSDVMKKGELAVTIGTSGAVRMTLRKFKPDPQGRLFNYILYDDYYVAGGATNNGAAILNWFNQAFDGEPDGPDSFEPARVPAGSEGLIFLPYLFGERAPIYDPSARGVFFGIGIHHTKEHFRKAVIEGICHQVKAIATSMKSLGPVSSVTASGGFTRSPGWVQVLADVMGKEIRVVNEVDASALGAAKLAFHSLGIAVQPDWVTVKERRAPDSRNHAIYREDFKTFVRLYEKVKDEFPRRAARK